MMKKYFQLALLAVLVIAATASASAQKFGYVNSAEILAELPAVKAAESNLEAMQKQLQKKGQSMVEIFQQDYAALEAKQKSGEMAPKEVQEEASKLEVRQQEIAAFEQDMMTQIREKRNELLEPIYKSVNDAIAAVAKEKGYQFIFDQQVLLYGEEAADVSADVKAKLGL
ncbi:MAG: OmpH family outer membrane protein [Bacteroidota bacterium]